MDSIPKRPINTSYVLIVSQPDSTWLAEAPLYPTAKGLGLTPDTALANLLDQIATQLSALAQ